MLSGGIGDKASRMAAEVYGMAIPGGFLFFFFNGVNKYCPFRLFFSAWKSDEFKKKNNKNLNGKFKTLNLKLKQKNLNQWGEEGRRD